MSDLWLENSEVRLNGDGTVDEIVIRDARGKCLFHLEQVTDKCFWMAVYSRKKKSTDSIHVSIFTKNGRSHLTSFCDDQRAGKKRAKV